MGPFDIYPQEHSHLPDTNVNGFLQDSNDSFLDPDSNHVLISRDELYGGPRFASLHSAKSSALQDSTAPHHSSHASVPSPESPLQDSSSGSLSPQKGKLSSQSSQSGNSSKDMEQSMPINILSQIPLVADQEHNLDDSQEIARSFENIELANRETADFFDFNAASSADTLPFTGHAVQQEHRCVAIPYRHSPISPSTITFGNSTRETSPMSNPINPDLKSAQSPTSLSVLSAGDEHMEHLAGMRQPSWPFGNARMSTVQSNQLARTDHSLSMLQQPCTISHGLPYRESWNPTIPTNRYNFKAYHSTAKTRVETQIPLRLILWPMPEGVKRLRLPVQTLAKPKLFAKSVPKSPDTLELSTMLVCTSAMRDETKLHRAMTIAASGAQSRQNESTSGSSSSGKADTDDKDHPLNGGEVFICNGCIQRERKRAGRKKTKKPEEDDTWTSLETQRAIMFNTSEVRDWVVLQCTNTSNSQDHLKSQHGHPQPGQVDLMEIELPMRIACYCRHHREKEGFQVIITLKDYRGNFIAQDITPSILLSDDHKSNTAPSAARKVQPPFVYDPDMPICGREHAKNVNPAPYRNAHSTTDLQNLRQNIHTRIESPIVSPFANPQNHFQAAPNTVTPRNLSRQASPSAGGPAAKRRKASGGPPRVPDNLMMTRLISEPSSTPHLLNGNVAFYPLPHPNALPLDSVLTPAIIRQDRQMVSHVPHASAHVVGHQILDSNGFGLFPQGTHSQNYESLSRRPQTYSAPASALPSRAPSPTTARVQVTPQVNASYGLDLDHATFARSSPFEQRLLPVIQRIIPCKGPKAGGIDVTCMGSGFFQGLEVMFGTSVATKTALWSDTCLVCILPPAIGPGTVPVYFKHHWDQAQRAGLPLQQIPPQGSFEYIDDDEQEMLKRALVILGSRNTGRQEDATDIARRIIEQPGSTGPWSANHQRDGHSSQTANVRSSGVESLDCEAAVLQCLDQIDFSDSPFPARYDLENESGQTILHLAASLGYQRLAAGLLARGANPNYRDRNGMSPMHMAALNNHEHIVRRLRTAGGDSTLRSLAGFTPADMATNRVVIDAVESITLTRSRSVGPREVSSRSRASSFLSIPSSKISTQDSDDELYTEGDEVLFLKANEAQGEANADKTWPKSRRNSTSDEATVVTPPLESSHGLMYAAAAIAAWRDQLAAQLQQLQQSVNFTLPNLPTLPPIPNLSHLPDYQTHPMMRRFSSLVPQRGSRPGSSENGTDSKDNDYRWWEFLKGNNSPPAYDELYPGRAEEDFETKVASAAGAAAEVEADRKCTRVLDNPWTRSSNKDLTTAQIQELRLVHTKNVKRLKSDRKLFMIWIPLLVLVLAAMLKDRIPELWCLAQAASTYFSGVL